MYDRTRAGLSASGQTQLDIAATLGHTMIGTAGDPSSRATLGDNPANPNQIGWQEAARRANVVGGILADRGLRWYWHPEQNAFQFFGGDLGNNDALYTGEGSIGKGYPVDPDPGVVGFEKLFDDVAVKGAKFYIVESDNAIGPGADPGRSLRHAKLGIEYLLGLRAGPNADGHSDVSEDTPIRERGRGGGRVVAGGSKT